MFSTSTTASSTSSPIAIASPPSVMVLMDKPANQKITAVARIDTGMAVSEIAVVRQLSRKANSTTATTTAASSSTRCTLWIEVSMKFACRNTIWSARMPCGRLAVIWRSASSISRGQLDRVDVGLLLDRDHHRGLAHVTGIAALDLRGELDVGDLAQIDRAAVDGRHHHAAHVVEAGGAPDIADEIFARILVGEAATGIGAELGERLLDLFVRDTERAQRRWMRRRRGYWRTSPPIGITWATPGNGQEPRPDDEVGGLAQLHRCGPLAGDGDEQDLAHDRADRPHLRQRVGRAAGRG